MHKYIAAHVIVKQMASIPQCGSWKGRECCGCDVWAAGAAASIAASSLKHMLNSQDALLGPWLPGRDMLEDELRTFVGEQRI